MNARSDPAARARTRAGQPEVDDDLLQPSLEADFDVRRMQPMYEPKSLLLPCFFGGAITGGLLFGLNYLWMGRRRSAWITWIGGIVLGLSLVVALAWVRTSLDEDAVRSSRPLIRLAIPGASVAAGWILARLQRPQFEAFVNARRRKRPLFWHGLAACIVGWVVALTATFVVVAVKEDP